MTAFIDDVDAVLKQRNALVHRVWSHSAATESAGWRQVPPSQRKKGQDWIEVAAYTPENCKQLIAEFVLVAERARDIVSLTSAMDRKPQPLPLLKGYWNAHLCSSKGTLGQETRSISVRAYLSALRLCLWKL